MKMLKRTFATLLFVMCACAVCQAQRISTLSKVKTNISRMTVPTIGSSLINLHKQNAELTQQTQNTLNELHKLQANIRNIEASTNRLLQTNIVSNHILHSNFQKTLDLFNYKLHKVSREVKLNYHQTDSLLPPELVDSLYQEIMSRCPKLADSQQKD